MRMNVEDEYFAWLVDIVCKNRFSDKISFRKLLTYLHRTEFRYLILKDENRADDGISLRHRFALYHPEIEDAESYLDGPCSVLEMMIALAIRCEEDIEDDPIIGDRTAQWFWGMIVSLGLGSMADYSYDRAYVRKRVNAFLDRDYEPNGKGGLFTVRHTNEDMRQLEIWWQMCRYLNEIN